MHAPTLRHTLLSATTFLVLSSLTPRDAHADCLGWGDQVLADRYVPNGTPGIRLVLALAANVENISEGYVQLERRSAQGDFDSVPHDISADAEEDEHYFWVRESGGMVDDATYRVTITNLVSPSHLATSIYTGNPAKWRSRSPPHPLRKVRSRSRRES